MKSQDVLREKTLYYIMCMEQIGHETLCPALLHEGTASVGLSGHVIKAQRLDMYTPHRFNI